MASSRKLFFISYSREDTRFVGPVVALLKSAENRVFFDIETLEPGDEWEAKLERALNEAAKVYVFWCQHSKESRWVRKEWQRGLEKNKKIVPVLLDHTRLPRKLKTKVWIDFRSAWQLHPRTKKMHGGAFLMLGAGGSSVLASWLSWIPDIVILCVGLLALGIYICLVVIYIAKKGSREDLTTEGAAAALQKELMKEVQEG